MVGSSTRIRRGLVTLTTMFIVDVPRVRVWVGVSVHVGVGAGVSVKGSV